MVNKLTLTVACETVSVNMLKTMFASMPFSHNMITLIFAIAIPRGNLSKLMFASKPLIVVRLTLWSRTGCGWTFSGGLDQSPMETYMAF